MRYVDIIRRAGKNLRQAKGRTILTSLAIAVGATTITLALAAGTGGRAYMNEVIATSGDARALTVYPKQIAVEDQGLPKYGVADLSSEESSLSYLDDQDIAKFKNQAGVESATPSFWVDAEYVTRSNVADAPKLIAPLEVQTDKTDMVLAAGSLQDKTIPAGGVVLPEAFLSDFGFSSAEAAIGQPLTLHFIRNDPQSKQPTAQKDVQLKIVAVDTNDKDSVIYYSQSLKLGAVDGEEIYAFTVVGEARYSGASVRVKADADLSTVQQALRDAGYEVYSLQENREALMQAVTAVSLAIAGFGVITLIASVFGIINTQYISVLERTQQIGLMKSLGARGKDVSRLFRFEAAWIGLIGGLIGTAVALLVGLANPLISQFMNFSAETKLLVFEPLNSILLILALMLIAIFSGYFPARKAAKLDPIEALRSE